VLPASGVRRAGLLSLEIRFSVSAKADREGVFVGRSRGGAEASGDPGKEATSRSMASGAGRVVTGDLQRMRESIGAEGWLMTPASRVQW
jgi:hypothetical protein